jgi:hypothetical protein
MPEISGAFLMYAVEDSTISFNQIKSTDVESILISQVDFAVET